MTYYHAMCWSMLHQRAIICWAFRGKTRPWRYSSKPKSWQNDVRRKTPRMVWTLRGSPASVFVLRGFNPDILELTWLMVLHQLLAGTQWDTHPSNLRSKVVWNLNLQLQQKNDISLHVLAQFILWLVDFPFLLGPFSFFGWRISVVGCIGMHWLLLQFHTHDSNPNILCDFFSFLAPRPTSFPEFPLVCCWNWCVCIFWHPPDPELHHHFPS